MATLQDFRVQVQVRAASSLYRNFDSENFTHRVFRESISGYTEEVITPVRRARVTTTVDALEIFRVDPLRVIDSLRAGEKAFQLRVWQIEEDLSSDSNTKLITAGVEIEVFRKLRFPDEEYLYTSDEMLDAMSQLLDQAAWKALTAFDSFADGDTPSIDGVPERDNDILRFTVAFSAVVAPN